MRVTSANVCVCVCVSALNWTTAAAGSGGSGGGGWGGAVGRVRLVDAGARVLVDRVGVADAGEYECHAHNPAGHDRLRYQISVLGTSTPHHHRTLTARLHRTHYTLTARLHRTTHSTLTTRPHRTHYTLTARLHRTATARSQHVYTALTTHSQHVYTAPLHHAQHLHTALHLSDVHNCDVTATRNKHVHVNT